MAQQTAVQWLLSELQIRLLKIKSESDGIVRERMINSFLIDAEQAEAIEKEQIINFGNDLLAQNDRSYIGFPDLAKQYYNETFGK